ncbi:MAG: hypothetical protein WB772_07165 [Xanthobacteraceae bacterium]
MLVVEEDAILLMGLEMNDPAARSLPIQRPGVPSLLLCLKP